MDTLLADIRYSLRTIRKSPGVIAVAVLSLGLGIGACVSIFSPVDVFMFRPLPELSQYATPFEGLFLSSAGMHPGGGIFGAAGFNCSRVVRRYLRKRFF